MQRTEVYCATGATLGQSPHPSVVALGCLCDEGSGAEDRATNKEPLQDETRGIRQGAELYR